MSRFYSNVFANSDMLLTYNIYIRFISNIELRVGPTILYLSWSAEDYLLKYSDTPDCDQRLTGACNLTWFSI